MSADVLSLSDWRERKQHIRGLHYSAATLSREYAWISYGPDWRLGVVAALTIFMTEDKRQKEEFMLTVARPVRGRHANLDPHLIITDEGASEAWLAGKTLDEITQFGLGSYATCFPASGEMRLGAGVTENFATAFAKHANAASVYVGLAVDSYGYVRLQDVSPYGSEIYADFGSEALEDETRACIAADPVAVGAKILTFPSKSTS